MSAQRMRRQLIRSNAMNYPKVGRTYRNRSVAMALLLLLGNSPAPVLGGGATDGSVGPVQSLSGCFTVPETLGSLKGNNLFHSFARFSIEAGEKGIFTTTTGSIRNVISRVTGGEVSAIHGLLKLDAASGSRPDFYFVNPAGVVFGAGARVEVPAGLHVSTAQRIQFADGFVWETTPTASALTMASPEAFGFVGSQSPASVLLHNKDAAGNRASSPTSIELKPGSSFSITAGPVQFDSANVSVSEGGQLKIQASGELSVLNGSVISSSTASDKAAGSINVGAVSLIIDRGESKITGILSQTEGAGDAGRVGVKVTGPLSILGGDILSETKSGGSAGRIDVEAAKMTIDGLGFARGISNDVGKTSSGGANFGQVRVKISGELRLLRGGQISSSTLSEKSAGSVDIEAGTLTIDGRNFPRATGIFTTAALGSSSNAGAIKIKVAGSFSILDGGEISSDTQSGNAGTIDVQAHFLSIEGKGPRNPSRISSRALPGSTGDAGEIVAKIFGKLSVSNGGSITTRTLGSGKGGKIDVAASQIMVDGVESSITAEAAAGSSGRVGSVTVVAREGLTLSNGGKVSIENDAIVSGTPTALFAIAPRVGLQDRAPAATQPTVLSVSAPNLTLLAGGLISAASSGNVASSNIGVNFSNLLVLRNAAITTTAQDGNGGAIRISGGRGILLDRSEVTTSVLGTQNGNGGDITIKASALAMDTGFIRANTAAPKATGGNVFIDVDALVPSGNTLGLGGDTPVNFERDVFALNVIQAAAPEGVSGSVDVTSPALDIAGSLRGLSAEVVDFGALGKDPCRVGAGSSLTPVGRGGLRPSASGLIRPEDRYAPPRVGEGGFRWSIAAFKGGIGVPTMVTCY
jgi:filamentous hemagglutinin family protein